MLERQPFACRALARRDETHRGRRHFAGLPSTVRIDVAVPFSPALSAGPAALIVGHQAPVGDRQAERHGPSRRSPTGCGRPASGRDQSGTAADAVIDDRA